MQGMPQAKGTQPTVSRAPQGTGDQPGAAVSPLRDRIAYRLACAVLRLATPTYRRQLRECYERGLYPLGSKEKP